MLHNQYRSHNATCGKRPKYETLFKYERYSNYDTAVIFAVSNIISQYHSLRYVKLFSNGQKMFTLTGRKYSNALHYNVHSMTLIQMLL
jgi:hypothetical protein